MDMGLLFWFLMILWGLSVIGSFANWNSAWFVTGGSILQWILFGLLGWKVFGPILH